MSTEVPVDAVGVQITLQEHGAFGALVAFGLSGVATELLDDRAYAIVPLTEADAEELLVAPRAAPLLTGYRGAPPADLLALRDLVLRLSALGEALPEVAECTVHVLAAPIGAHIAAVSVRVAPATARFDTGPRRLRGL